MFSVPELLILFAAVGGSGMMVGILGWGFMRIRKLETTMAAHSLLAERVDELRHELAAARDEVTELVERVEFAERLLTRGKDDRPIP